MSSLNLNKKYQKNLYSKHFEGFQIEKEKSMKNIPPVKVTERWKQNGGTPKMSAATHEKRR